MSDASNSEEESKSASVNKVAVEYIIPVSVAVGVILAAITIGCVCYRRWRDIYKTRQMQEDQTESKESIEVAKSSSESNSDSLAEY